MQQRYSTVLGDEQEQGIGKVYYLIAPRTMRTSRGEDIGEARLAGGEGQY
jgi:hypothetical protein